VAGSLRCLQGKMEVMTTTGGPVARQLDLFGAVPDAVPEPVLMVLHASYYDLIDLAGRQDARVPAVPGGPCGALVRLPERAGVAADGGHRPRPGRGR
jgi:hypothetical protein